MVEAHRQLDARATLPFASFIYFCCEDNSYINRFANSVEDVSSRFSREGLPLTVLFPGDDVEVAGAADHPGNTARARFEAARAAIAALPYRRSEVISASELLRAGERRLAHLKSRYWPMVLKRITPVSIAVPDLKCRFRLDIAKGEFILEPGELDQADVEVFSQPLHFALQHPFGLQTLGVSARFLVRHNARAWRQLRILFAMDNAEVYLNWRDLLSSRMMRFAAARAPVALNQLKYKLSRMS